MSVDTCWQALSEVLEEEGRRRGGEEEERRRRGGEEEERRRRGGVAGGVTGGVAGGWIRMRVWWNSTEAHEVMERVEEEGEDGGWLQV